MTADSSGAEPSRSNCLKRGIAWWMRPKVLIVGLVLLLIITAPLGYRGYRISQVPLIDEPFDTQALLEFEVPYEDNARDEYLKAMRAYVEPKSDARERWDHGFYEIQLRGWVQASESVRQWLADNRPALEHWKRGTAKQDLQYFRIGSDTDDAINELASGLPTADNLGQLACLESTRLQAEGNTGAAWDWLLINHRASHHFSRHGTFSDAFESSRLLDITAKSIARWVQHRDVDPHQLRRAMADISEEDSRRPSVP
jgi:hypothetical protein